jgi:hypothetical protein
MVGWTKKRHGTDIIFQKATECIILEAMQIPRPFSLRLVSNNSSHHFQYGEFRLHLPGVKQSFRKYLKECAPIRKFRYELRALHQGRGWKSI